MWTDTSAGTPRWQWRVEHARRSEGSGNTPGGCPGPCFRANRHPHTARSGCRRLMFNARHTKFHSPRALAHPRTLKRRNPRTSLIQPLGASDSHLRLRVPLPARSQLLDHPVRRRVRFPVLVRHPLALASRRHVPVEPPRLKLRQVPLVAVPGVGKHRLGLLVVAIQLSPSAPVRLLSHRFLRRRLLAPGDPGPLLAAAIGGLRRRPSARGAGGRCGRRERPGPSRIRRRPGRRGIR